MNVIFDLQLFADGAAAAEGSGTGFGSEGVANPTPGVAPAAAENTTEAPKAEETFEDLIKGKYKEDFNKRMQAAIKKRVGDTKALETENARMREALAIAQQRYGTKDGDWEALTNALAEDEEYLEKEAYEKGIDKETLKTMKRMERENAKLKQNQLELERQARQEAAYQKLMQEDAEVKAVYPNFDIDVELQNPQFESLIRNNINLKTAYEVVHHDEILPQAMKFAADKTKSDVSKVIQSGAARPAELGAGSVDSPAGKTDVSKLTRAQRDEINRRVMSGERVVL